MKVATTIVTVILVAISIIQSLRLLLRWNIIMHGMKVQILLSVFGCLVPAALAVMLWLDNRN